MPPKNKADQKTTRDAEEFLPKPPDRKEYERAMSAIKERLKEIDTELVSSLPCCNCTEGSYKVVLLVILVTVVFTPLV